MGYIDVRVHAEDRLQDSERELSDGKIIGMLDYADKNECCTIYEDGKKEGYNLYCRDKGIAIAFKQTYKHKHRSMNTIVKSVFDVENPEHRFKESDRFEEAE